VAPEPVPQRACDAELKPVDQHPQGARLGGTGVPRSRQLSIGTVTKRNVHHTMQLYNNYSKLHRFGKYREMVCFVQIIRQNLRESCLKNDDGTAITVWSETSKIPIFLQNNENLPLQVYNINIIIRLISLVI